MRKLFFTMMGIVLFASCKTYVPIKTPRYEVREIANEKYWSLTEIKYDSIVYLLFETPEGPFLIKK